jgi:streptomycin 3"-adenylyltransferase
MHGEDKDLAAHFAVTREVGFALYGPPVEEVFAPVPREAFLDSLRYDIADAADGMKDNPVYYILNLCRALAYLRRTGSCPKSRWGMGDPTSI